MEFNIVFHGMMLFVEQGDQCLVLMPEIKEHDYRYGDPTVTPKPRNLWPGDYSVKGITPRSQSDSFKYHSHKYLVLDPSGVTPVQQLERISVSVPMPDYILPFRQIVPDPGNSSRAEVATLLNGMNPKILPCVPKHVNDVIVFNYQDVDGDDVSLRAADGTVISAQLETLCLYAQTGFDDTALTMIATNEGDAPQVVPHRTGINDLLHCQSGGSSGHTTFELSKIGTAGDIPDPLPHGLLRTHLLNLRELSPFITNESGCVGAAISRA